MIDICNCYPCVLGDMMLSFPAGIVSVLASNPYPAPLQFRQVLILAKSAGADILEPEPRVKFQIDP